MSKPANRAVRLLSGISIKLRKLLLQRKAWRKFIPGRKLMWCPCMDVFMGIVDLLQSCRLWSWQAAMNFWISGSWSVQLALYIRRIWWVDPSRD